LRLAGQGYQQKVSVKLVSKNSGGSLRGDVRRQQCCTLPVSEKGDNAGLTVVEGLAAAEAISKQQAREVEASRLLWT
jgi:hypothetical protein